MRALLQPLVPKGSRQCSALGMAASGMSWRPSETLQNGSVALTLRPSCICSWMTTNRLFCSQPCSGMYFCFPYRMQACRQEISFCHPALVGPLKQTGFWQCQLLTFRPLARTLCHGTSTPVTSSRVGMAAARMPRLLWRVWLVLSGVRFMPSLQVLPDVRQPRQLGQSGHVKGLARQEGKQDVLSCARPSCADPREGQIFITALSTCSRPWKAP